MNKLNNDSSQGVSINFGDEISMNSTIYTNVDQEIVITTVDKIKLVLISTRDIMAAQRSWITPITLFFSCITTLSTSEFKDSLGLKKEFWHSAFLLLAIVSAIMFVISFIRLIKNIGKNDINLIIDQIKIKK
jgi:hypothetical protein